MLLNRREVLLPTSLIPYSSIHSAMALMICTLLHSKANCQDDCWEYIGVSFGFKFIGTGTLKATKYSKGNIVSQDNIIVSFSS